MDRNEFSKWTHSHQFNLEKKKAEARTKIVVLITLVVMTIEIVAGWYYGSMALFADGWHMMTHAMALGISLFAYVLARKLSNDRRFAFGTWKIEILGAYTSAIVLGIIGIFIVFVSVRRVLNPVVISYDQALVVAMIGLVVNVVCAVILHGGEEHSHNHVEGHEHRDMNLQSAYLHVIADALTSALAIIALLGAKLYSWNFLDPLMGIIGALLIFRWAYLLIRKTAVILIDREMDEKVVKHITEILQSDESTQVSDIHIWRVSQQKYACLISLVTCEPLSVEYYKSRLHSLHEIDHLTIEVNCYT